MKRTFVWLYAWLLIGGLMSQEAWGFPSYYDIPLRDQAQAEARQRNLPIAWLGSFPEDLTVGAPVTGGTAELTQMAMSTLRGRAVIIFFDGRNMAPVPAMIHAEFHKQDDGPQPNNVNWISPKIVFVNPENTVVLGRVSFTQMKANREAAINSALQIIKNTPDALAPPPTSTPGSTTANDPVVAQPEAANSASDYLFDITIVVGLCVAGFFLWKARSQGSE